MGKREEEAAMVMVRPQPNHLPGLSFQSRLLYTSGANTMFGRNLLLHTALLHIIMEHALTTICFASLIFPPLTPARTPYFTLPVRSAYEMI